MRALFGLILFLSVALPQSAVLALPSNNLTGRNVVNPRFSFAEIVRQIEPLSHGTNDRFARELSNEFRSLAIFRANVIGDYAGAELFARKALFAFYGDHVMPENPARHNVPEWSIIELSTVHSDILRILDADVVDNFPMLLAEMVVKFDCWVNAVAWDPDGGDMTQASVCRERVYKAIDALFERMAEQKFCPPPRATRARGVRLIGQDGGAVPDKEESPAIALPRWDRRLLTNTLPQTEDATVVAIRRATVEMKEAIDQSRKDFAQSRKEMDELFRQNVAEVRKLLSEIAAKATVLEEAAKREQTEANRHGQEEKPAWPDKPPYPPRPVRPSRPIAPATNAAVGNLAAALAALQRSIDNIKTPEGFAAKSEITRLKVKLDGMASCGDKCDNSELLSRLSELEKAIAAIANRIDELTGMLATDKDDYVLEIVNPEDPVAPWIFQLFFDWGSDKVDRKFLPQLVDLAQRVKGNPRVEVEGHTDTTGSEDYNLQLSLRRARNVARILQAHGVPKQAIILKPRAFHEPKVPTDMNVKEPANRRVVVR